MSTEAALLEFIAELYRLSDANEQSKATALAMRFLDDALNENRFGDCDAAFAMVDPSRLKTSVAYSMLMITRKAPKSKSRSDFVAAFRKHVAKINGRKYARELVENC